MSDPNGERTAVLCVESARDDEAVSVQCLLPESYVLFRLHDAKAAAGTLRHRAFDAYLIEIDGRPESALQLCEAIRRRDPHAPVVLYASELSAALQADAKQAGASRLLETACLTRGQIAHQFAQCVAEAEVANLAAVSAELVAMHEQFTVAPARHLELPEAMALEHYLAAGGTRAGFARSWAAVRGGGPSSRPH